MGRPLEGGLRGLDGLSNGLAVRLIRFGLNGDQVAASGVACVNRQVTVSRLSRESVESQPGLGLSVPLEHWRHWNIIDAHLAGKTWMLDDTHSVLDMAVWGWARAVPFALGPDAWEQMPNMKRPLDAVNYRPAAQRTALLKDKHNFKTEMDDEARLAMFPHLAPAQA